MFLNNERRSHVLPEEQCWMCGGKGGDCVWCNGTGRQPSPDE